MCSTAYYLALTTRRLLPRWPRTIAQPLVKRLQVRHATGLLASAKAAIARAALNVGASVFRFTSSSLPTTASNGDCGASVDSGESVASDAAFFDHLNNGSSQVWSTPQCLPNQENAVETIIHGEECRVKLLVIDRTALGKSHILQMISTMLGGIVLLIVLILLITANQMAKNQSSTVESRFGSRGSRLGPSFCSRQNIVPYFPPK